MVPGHRGEAREAHEGHRPRRRTLRGAVRLIHFCDANLFIYATIGKGSEGEDSRRAIAHLTEGGWEGVTSSLVVDEVLWSIWKNASKDLALETAERLYGIPHLAVIGVSGRAAQQALPLMKKYPLKPRDAFHVATMLEAGIPTIVSTDAGFDKVKEIRRIEPAAVARRR